jgi:hypothetical protein
MIHYESSEGLDRGTCQARKVVEKIKKPESEEKGADISAEK